MPGRERNREHGGACTIGAAVLTLSLLPSSLREGSFLVEAEDRRDERGKEREK